MKRLFLIAVLSLVVALPAFSAGFFKIGEAAPNFTLTSLAGETVSLAGFKGKVVVLGLFHICEPCLEQGTNLQKVHEATKGRNVQVVGVNSAGNSKGQIAEFLKAFPVTVTYPYLVDPKKETDKLYGGGKFIPNVYVIDQQGIIRWQRVGTMELAGDEVILQEVNKLLSSGKTGT